MNSVLRIYLIILAASQNLFGNTTQQPPKISTAFKFAVSQGRYRDAVRMTCKRFNMNCKSITITKSSKYGRAYTYRNRVHVTRRSFFKLNNYDENVSLKPKEALFELADDRALFFMLSHEIYHRDNQEYLNRWLSSAVETIRGIAKGSIEIEYDAWAYSVATAKKLGFSSKASSGHNMSDIMTMVYLEGQFEFYAAAREIGRYPFED